MYILSQLLLPSITLFVLACFVVAVTMCIIPNHPHHPSDIQTSTRPFIIRLTARVFVPAISYSALEWEKPEDSIYNLRSPFPIAIRT